MVSRRNEGVDLTEHTYTPSAKQSNCHLDVPIWVLIIKRHVYEGLEQQTKHTE